MLQNTLMHSYDRTILVYVHCTMSHVVDGCRGHSNSKFNVKFLRTKRFFNKGTVLRNRV